MEKFSYSKNMTEKEKEAVNNNLKQIQLIESSQIEGELEKTPQDIEIIKIANSMLQNEMRNLGIKTDIQLLEGQVHLFNEKTYKIIFPNINAPAYQQGYGLYFNKDYFNDKNYFLYALLHETAHFFSKTKCFVNINNKQFKIKTIKSGLRIGNKTKAFHKHFRGLNEAVIDLTAYDLMTQHRELLKKKFGINQEKLLDILKEKDSYLPFINILDIIFDKLNANADNLKNEKNNWTTIKRDCFTGETTFLRKMRKNFGKESLRILAALGSCQTNEDLCDEDVTIKIKQYFETENKDERDRIAKEILNKEELKKYTDLQKISYS